MIYFVLLEQLKAIGKKINEQCDQLQKIDVDESAERKKLEAKIGNLRSVAESCEQTYSVGQHGEGAIKQVQSVPENILYPVANHILFGKKAGSFTEALLRNDLRLAVGHADHHTYGNLHAIVMMLHNDAPAACWGSDEKVDQWRKWVNEDKVMTESERRMAAERLRKHGYEPQKSGV